LNVTYSTNGNAQKHERRPLARGRGGVWTTSCLTLLPDLVRPFARRVLGRLDLLPSLAAEDADEARTVCGCQPVAFMISASVTPLARFIIAITSAFLLVRSAFGLAAAFLARPTFFAGLAFLLALRAPLGFAVSGPGLLMFSESIAFSLIVFSLTGLRSSQVITPVRRNHKRNLRAIRSMRRMPGGLKGKLAGMVPFLIGRQNQVGVNEPARLMPTTVFHLPPGRRGTRF
jgi:hypothetical protein